MMCPYFFDVHIGFFGRLGQKSLQKFCWFIGQFEDTKKGHFEIN